MKLYNVKTKELAKKFRFKTKNLEDFAFEPYELESNEDFKTLQRYCKSNSVSAVLILGSFVNRIVAINGKGEYIQNLLMSYQGEKPGSGLYGKKSVKEMREYYESIPKDKLEKFQEAFQFNKSKDLPLNLQLEYKNKFLYCKKLMLNDEYNKFIEECFSDYHTVLSNKENYKY